MESAMEQKGEDEEEVEADGETGEGLLEPDLRRHYQRPADLLAERLRKLPISHCQQYPTSHELSLVLPLSSGYCLLWNAGTGGE